MGANCGRVGKCVHRSAVGLRMWISDSLVYSYRMAYRGLVCCGFKDSEWVMSDECVGSWPGPDHEVVILSKRGMAQRVCHENSCCRVKLALRIKAVAMWEAEGFPVCSLYRVLLPNVMVIRLRVGVFGLES